MMRIFNWLRRGKLERGLHRELEYHIDRRVSDLVRSGLPEWEARRQATLELGGLTQVQEEVRDVWLGRWLRDFAYDIRYSARSFRRSPSFTATTVLSLALGIGATTAIYSLVNQVVLQALPVHRPERLVLIDWKGDPLCCGMGTYNLMSYPICRDLQLQDRFFEGALCRAATTVNLSTGGEYRPAAAEIVSGSYFPVLGVSAALGRVLGSDDDGTPGANPVVVLSYDFWKTQFASAPDVIGRKVLVNQNPMTVIGFANLLDRRMRWMQVLGRLRPDVTAAQAQAGLQPWFKAMLDEDTRRAGFPRVTAERRQRFLASTLVLTPAPQGHSPLRRRLAQPLWVLLAATAVLLGLACLNVAGLFLARGSARAREISTRLALGASRRRISRQFLADGVLLALTGGTLGVLLAPLAMQALIAFLPRDAAANALHSTVDSRLLLFTFLVSVAAGILSGFAPALQAGRASFISSLRERGGTGFGGVPLRKAIVTVQIAFTLILVSGGALFVRTLTGLMAKGPGFATPSLVSFGLDPRRNGYSRKEASQLIRRIYDELRSSPGTQMSAVTRVQLLTGGSAMNPMTIQTNERITTDGAVNYNAVSPGFFATLGIRLIAGRDFDARDSRPVGELGQRSAIINESFVKRYLAGRNPLGARIGQGSGPDAKPNIEIVGVVADFSYRGLREEPEQAYFPIFEGDDTGGNFYVKVRGTPK